MLITFWQILIKFLDTLLIVLDMPGKWVFGRDIFISYSRADAAKYAAGLAKQLSAYYSCYLDQWASPRGTKLPLSIRRAIHRSSMLVLVGTKGAIESQFVKQELGSFVRTRRPLIPININGELDGAPWEEEPWSNIHRVSQAMDTEIAKDNGKPSPSVIDYIKDSADFTRQDQRLRTIAGCTAASVIIVLGGTLALSTNWVNKANKQALKAEGRAKQARAQEQEATKNALTQSRIAFARRLAAQADLAHSPDANQLERNMLYSIESLKRDYSLEAYRNTLAGLKLFPRSTGIRMPHPKDVEAIRYSPDGKLVATFAGDLAWLWRASDLMQAMPPLKHDQPVRAMIFSHEGKYLATSSGNTVRIWEVSTGHELPAINHYSSVDCLEFSRDERYVALAGGQSAPAKTKDPERYMARVWEIESSQREVACMPHTAGVSSIAFKPDGKSIATLSDNTVLNRTTRHWYTRITAMSS